MASIEKMDKKLSSLRQKLDGVQHVIKSKKEIEKHLLKDIADIEAKRNGEIFSDMSKVVQQEKLDITPDDMKYMIEALKERKGKTLPTGGTQASSVKEESDNIVEKQNETNRESTELSSGDKDYPFQIRDPFSRP